MVAAGVASGGVGVDMAVTTGVAMAGEVAGVDMAAVATGVEATAGAQAVGTGVAMAGATGVALVGTEVDVAAAVEVSNPSAVWQLSAASLLSSCLSCMCLLVMHASVSGF